MKVEIRGNAIHIEGYVNAVERDSLLLSEKMSPKAKGKFVERVASGVFAKSIERSPIVELRFNHGRTVGGTMDGTLELREDNIGLKAKATITDTEVITSARANKLKGWSFGFETNADCWEDMPDGTQRRTLEDIELKEVSILSITPAYTATSVEMRGDDVIQREQRSAEDEAEIKNVDYSLHEKELEILKLKGKV